MDVLSNHIFHFFADFSTTTLLQGKASEHNDRMAPLVLNDCGYPIEFNPASLEDGGMMALWDNVKGGEFPWDPNYYTDEPDTSSGL
jgi:hypothetical protein